MTEDVVVVEIGPGVHQARPIYAPEQAVQDTYTRFHTLQQEIATGLIPDPCVALRSENLDRNGQYEQETIDTRPSSTRRCSSTTRVAS